MKSFYNQISGSESEKEVSDVYIDKLKKYIKYEEIKYIYNCDGYLEGTIKYDPTNHIIKLLMEFKKDKNFFDKKDKCEVVLQALFYIRDIMNNSLKTPQVLLIGDKNSCFIIGIEDIIKYLDMDIDWNIAASLSYTINKKIIDIMINDDNVNPFLFRIDESFNFKDVINEIDKLAKGLKYVVSVSEENIEIAYDYFISNVIKNIENHNAIELVQIFISTLVNPEDNFKHPHIKDVLVTSNGKRISIDGQNFEAYFKHFKSKYKPSEIKRFTEISDRLIESTSRRKKGEYYTPTTWVNIANDYINKGLGVEWRNKFVVWDCAWGTGNLTRDYKFKNLFCSTIDEQDLSIGSSYNREAKKKFQYDFLNDDIHLHVGSLFDEKIKIPEELLEAFENNDSIVFLINPPLGAAGSGGAKGTSKENIAKSKVNRLMKDRGLGKSSQ